MIEQLDIDELTASTRKFIARELEPLSSQIEEGDVVPAPIVSLMATQGYFGLTLPVDYGGLGLGIAGYWPLVKEFGRTHSAFFHLIENNNGVCGELLCEVGSSKQKAELLPRMASGEAIVAFALSEPEAGSDAGSVRTSAIESDGGFMLRGLKHYISNAEWATHFAVTARMSSEGLAVFVVERDRPGLRIGRRQHMMGLRGGSHHEIALDDCWVPREAMLGSPGEGFKAVTGALRKGRLSRAAFAIGIAGRALELAIDYARDRRQFGQPIGTFQGVQWLLADSATELLAAEAMLGYVAERVDAGTERRRETAMVKLFATEAAGRIVDRALQVFGGAGYVTDLPLERMYRDVRVERIVEGTSEIQRLIIARSLLREVGLSSA